MVHSREDEEVGMVHEVKSPENKTQFSQMTMGQHWLGELIPNKLSGGAKILSKIATEFYFFILQNFLLTE